MGSWKRLTKPRFLFVYPLGVTLFLMSRVTETSLRIGLVVIVLGQIVRLWANGYVGHQKVNWTQKWRGDAKIGRLTTAGPYAFVRHPLYLGTFLIGTGFCIAVGYVWASVLAFAGFWWAYRVKMTQEEALLQDECGKEYSAYHAAVPRLLPFRPPYRHRNGTWKWAGVVASKEWKTVIWVTVVIIGLYFWEERIQEREPFFGEHAEWRVLLVVIVIALASIDGAMELRKRRARQAGQPAAAA